MEPMQKSMRKLLSLLLTLAMLLSMPLTALAEEGEAGEENPVTEEVVTEEAPAVEAPAAQLAADEEEAVLAAIGDTDVAAIGDTGYATLAEAITAANAATEDVTITLLKDAEITANTEIANTSSKKTTLTVADGATANVTITVKKRLRFNTDTDVLGTADAGIVFDGNKTNGTAHSNTYALQIRTNANVKFDYVTVQNFNASYSNSAPIRVDAGVLTVNNSLVQDNSGKNSGGIYLASNPNALSMSNTEFKDNTSTGGAGAFYANIDTLPSGVEDKVTMTNCSFTGNGGPFGNVARLRLGTLRATNCSFTGNSGSGRGTIYMGNGSSGSDGTASTGYFTNCTFTNNKTTNTTYADTTGDIILLSKNEAYTSTAVVDGCTMSSSGTDAVKYSIASCESYQSLTLQGAVDIENIYLKDGQTISIPAAGVSLKSGASPIEVTGGAIGDTILTGEGVATSYQSFKTLVSGGAIGADGKIAEDSSAAGAVAQANGTYYTTLDAAIKAVGTPTEATVIYLLGDAVYSAAASYTIPANVSFSVQEDQQASIKGATGAVVTFNGNNASRGSSQMFNVAKGGKLTLEHVTISGSKTSGGSGAAIITYGTLTMSNCTLSGNTVEGKKSGGAIYADSAAVTATGCTFSNNSATNYGGAIYFCKTCTVSLTNCTISNNSNTGSGGAIYWTGSTKGTISGGEITGNTSDNYGGAIYTGSSSSITLTGGVSITGNTAKNANGYGAYFCGTTTISGATIKDNATESTSKKQETAIYNNATLKLSGANDIPKLYVADANNSSIQLSGNVTGTVGIHSNDFSKYLADGVALLTSTTDGLIAASLSAFTLSDEAYGLLDTGYVAKYEAKFGTTKYTTVQEAIDAASDAAGGGTVTLLSSITVPTTAGITVKNDVTLDLNGKTITDEGGGVAAVGDAHIVDSSTGKTGLIATTKNGIVLNPSNKEMPVWIEETDAEGNTTRSGYAFETISEVKQTGSAADGTYTYICLPKFATASIAEMIGTDGAAAHGLSVNVVLTYDNDETTIGKITLTWSDDDVKTVYSGNEKAFYAWITNYAPYAASLQIKVTLKSELSNWQYEATAHSLTNQ